MSYMDDFEHLKIPLNDIKGATNNFGDKPIGNGGFGYVYKGELLLPKGKRTVAFKRLNRQFGQGDVEFWKEQPSILTRIKSFTFEQNHHDDQDDDVLDHHAQQPIEYVFNQPMHYQHFDFDQPTETETIATHYDFNAKYSGEVVSGADKFSGEFSGEVQDIETEDTLLDSEPTHEEILDANGVEDEFESMDDVYSKLVDNIKSKKMKKSRSLKVGFKDEYDDDVAAVEARRPETLRVKKEVMVEDDDGVEVDSRADDFINKFKNDLKLQRIESIMKKGGNKLN
nr:dual specificity protein kinase zak2-like [Tanacetum cinerariifolium]